MADAANTQEAPVYFLYGEPYTGNMPAYFDCSGMEWVARIEQHWKLIRDEILGALDAEHFPIPNHNPYLVDEARVWRNICFYNYTWKKRRNLKRFPVTAALLGQIPNLTYAAMNMLEPHAAIYPHHGDTNTTIRCHLGIRIPAGLPQCGIRVDGEERSWEEGKILAFSDAHLHSVWNHTDQHRFIFVIDVMHPDYAGNRNRICARVLATLSIKHFFYKLHRSSIPPKWILVPLQFFFSLLWQVFLALQSHIPV